MSKTIVTAVALVLFVSLTGGCLKKPAEKPEAKPTPAVKPQPVEPVAKTSKPRTETDKSAEQPRTQPAEQPAKQAAAPAEPKTTTAPVTSPPPATPGETAHVYVRMSVRNHGDIVLALNAEKAPRTVENFLAYVDNGHYEGTVFHRVIRTFMIQGGGFDADLNQKPTNPPVENESGNGLSNARGTIAMARTSAPDSATCQFFINVENNARLDGSPGSNTGYTVFGEVVAGMDVVDQIRAVQTGTGVLRGQGRSSNAPNVPVEPVVIHSVTRISAEEAARSR